MIDAIKRLIAATEQLDRSLDKETFGVKAQGGADGLDKVRKLRSLNLDKLLKVCKEDLKAAEKAASDLKREMDVAVSQVNAVAA